MTTLPHSNPENGYSVRIGKHLPSEAANLAYIHTDTPNPEKNLLVYDYSNAIPENNLVLGQSENYKAFTNEAGYLVTDKGDLVLSRPDVLLTDEYTIESNPKPLYFVSRTRYLFDARNASLSLPLFGGKTSQAKRFELYQAAENFLFVYESDKIKITKSGGNALDTQDHYKIMLEKEGNDPFTYRVLVYSDFQNGEAGYEVHYPAYQSGKNLNKTEILNPSALYTQSVLNPSVPTEKVFQLVNENNSQYRIKMNVPDEEETLVTPEERPPYDFTYQIEAEVSARLSDKNPATIRVGLVYINDTIYNAVKVTTAMKKLVYNNPLMPKYLTFENPHRQSGFNEKGDSNYWVTDLQMPKEHYLDYDILIISGYGDKDFSTVAESMREFLATGGTLILDNCGTGTSVLNPVNQDGKQTFIADIGFSKTVLAAGRRTLTANATMKDRFFNVTDVSTIGQVNPAITWNGQENAADWKTYITHQNGGPSLMEKQTGSIGKLIVSNMGLMLDVLYNNEATMKFLTNFILAISENRSFVSPVFKEQVYHKDNLYPLEYTDENGWVLYADDKNDEDDTQIVAKKILNDSVASFIKPYLPTPYQQYQSATFRTSVSDSGEIEITNGRMEQMNEAGTTLFEQTTLEAIPGFDLVKFSGTSVQGEHVTSIRKEGQRAIKLKTVASQGFWEQDLGVLPAGSYLLESYVRAESAQGGGMGIYRTDGSMIKATASVSGTKNWYNLQLAFDLTEATDTTARLGSHNAAATTTLYFDDLRLTSQGVIRMTPETTGSDPLYAYAISPKGKNLALTLLENTNNATELIKIDTEYNATLIVKSFVYQWFSAESIYKKEYGNQRNTQFSIKSSEGKKVLGNLISLVPALKSGAEWARKERVYYELTILTSEDSKYIDLSLYDPSIQQYFFTPQGEWIINHEDLWWNGYESTTQVRVINKANSLKTNRYTYAVKLREENQIKVLNPATLDERERWYLRVQNGSFQKSAISSKDAELMANAGRENYYDEFLSGNHVYQLPEYNRQTFYPVIGQRLIEDELAEYVNENTIQVQRTPLVIEEEMVVKEVLSRESATSLVWKSSHIMWNKNKLPQIYQDELSNNKPVLLTSGYQIDFDEGTVTFTKALVGTILASYTHDNFKITKRKYANARIKKELLQSRDNYTFESNHENWSISPAPVFYLGEKSESAKIHPATYAIDYKYGTVRFFQETRKRIYADYSYYEEVELEYADANRFTGEIKMNNRVSFKDEIYVSYLAEENAVEYKGYYDEEFETFLHLDLNPTAGHTYTARQSQNGKTSLIELPSEKLLGKELYLYVMPRHSTYYTLSRTNEHCLRHTFSEEQWLTIKSANPEALLLAKIQVRENTSIGQAVILDARRAGGGLKESISQEVIEQKVGYTSAFWDIGSFDGLTYYKNGVSIIRIPEKVLKINGGHFEEEDIRNSLDKYLAYGVYPIIEYLPSPKKPGIVFPEQPTTEEQVSEDTTAIIDKEFEAHVPTD